MNAEEVYVATQRADNLFGGPLRLTGRVQESDWGNVGHASRISSMVPGHAADARLAASVLTEAESAASAA